MSLSPSLTEAPLMQDHERLPSPRLSRGLKAFDAQRSVASLASSCLYKNSATGDCQNADYSIFHLPQTDAFEPIPVGKRTRQQETALCEMVQQSLLYLFDTNDVPVLCKSTVSKEQTPAWEHNNSSDDDDSAIKERQPKRQRVSTDEYSTMRFRGYQTEAWEARLADLQSFREREGHCSVPHSYPENAALARWVKRQRYQYKLRAEGKSSTMTASRIKVLEGIGFVWDSHLAAWEERLSDLRKYIAVHGHSEVPTHYQANKKLATWVKCQRRQYKLFLAGRQSTMNPERVEMLNNLGFSWEMMRSSKTNDHKNSPPLL